MANCINCLAITINNEKICSDCKTHSDQLEREHADGEYVEFECFHCGGPIPAEDVGKTDYCSLRCVNLDSAGPFRV